MTHIKHVSAPRAAQAQAKQDDIAGAIFLQIWLTVMSLLVGKIFQDL